MAEWVTFDAAFSDVSSIPSAVSALDVNLLRGILASNGDSIYKGLSLVSNMKRKKCQL